MQVVRIQNLVIKNRKIKIDKVDDVLKLSAFYYILATRIVICKEGIK